MKIRKNFKKNNLIKMKYKILIDLWKPYEQEVETEEDLKKILENINQIKDNYSYLDFKVFNDNNKDISESQFIQEIIGEILE